MKTKIMRVCKISNSKWLGLAAFLVGLLGLLEAASASPFLPSSRLSVRGGGFFGGKASPPPASNFFEQILAGAGEKVSVCP